MPTTLVWILGSGLLMSAIALIGSVTLLMKPSLFNKIVLPLVAIAAGSLIGGAFFHMIPAALSNGYSSIRTVFIWVALGFISFFALEQFIHHHHCHHKSSHCKKPLSYLILIGDGLHNFLGGLAIGGAFIMDIRLGIATWIAAAAHEVPQELGDFGVLIYSGWSRKRALLFNFLSGLTFPLGAILTYALSFHIHTDFLIAFAGGNFLYIGASDLVPEVNKPRKLEQNFIHFFSFTAGMAFLLALRFCLRE